MSIWGHPWYSQSSKNESRKKKNTHTQELANTYMIIWVCKSGCKKGSEVIHGQVMWCAGIDNQYPHACEHK